MLSYFYDDNVGSHDENQESLPIANARLKIAAVDETKPVAADDKAAVFRVTLPSGRTTLKTWFSNAGGDELCGAYYVYCRKVP